jgi:hypothetical protein
MGAAENKQLTAKHFLPSYQKATASSSSKVWLMTFAGLLVAQPNGQRCIKVIKLTS